MTSPFFPFGGLMKRLSIVPLMVLALFSAQCQQKKSETTQAPAPVADTSAQLSSVYYGYDSSLVDSAAAGALQGNAEFIKTKSQAVTVEGHCDERGTNEYNMALGARRAQSAKNYLINLGVDASMMRTISYGESKPVCTSSSESCWSQNRRADFRKR